MAHLVADIEIDVVNYGGPHDFQVLAEYVCPAYCNIMVRRLDTMVPTDGWTDSLTLLMCNSRGITKYINVGESPTNVVKIIEEPADNFGEFKPSNIREEMAPYYAIMPPQLIYHISRKEFNTLFETDVVVLPSNMYAIGIKGTAVYKYYDSYSNYSWDYEIDLTIRHIVNVALSMHNRRDFYFLICAYDGYMEFCYPSLRTIPYQIGDTENYGKVMVTVEDDTVYPVLHKYHYVLGQSVHPDTKYVIAMPDRYYFCLNRYNAYRSIHRGIPFSLKINKIVYAGNARGTKYNFTRRRDIELSQRDYFKSDAVGKENIHVPNQITREDMIKYKYVLDIDGNASTWDATAWKLNSGSVIMKTDSNWVQWFYDDYKAWQHYVPIADDFSDIQEKYKWCEEHQEECEKMIANCKTFFQRIYRYQNVVKYTEGVIATLCDIDVSP